MAADPGCQILCSVSTAPAPAATLENPNPQSAEQQHAVMRGTVMAAIPDIITTDNGIMGNQHKWGYIVPVNDKARWLATRDMLGAFSPVLKARPPTNVTGTSEEIMARIYENQANFDSVIA